MKVKTESWIVKGYKFFRVRRSSGTKGGAHYYHHADIVCENMQILNYLIDNCLIKNWRRIDKFGESNTDYESYEILGELESYHLRNFKSYIVEL